MNKKEFQSLLFRRRIRPEEKDYWSYVVAECLFRLEDKNIKECDCIEHSTERDKLKAALEKAIKLRSIKA